MAYKRMRQKLVRRDAEHVRCYLAGASEPRLHIGCGGNFLAGWLNTDLYPDTSDVCHLDATAPFPLPDSSFDLIFTEHVIEHIPLTGGLNLLAESFRVLKPGGRIPVGTPSTHGLIRSCEHPVEPTNRA